MQLKLVVNRERNCSTKRLWSNTIQVKNIQSTDFPEKEVSRYLKNSIWVNSKMQKKFLQKNVEKAVNRKMAHTVNRKM